MLNYFLMNWSTFILLFIILEFIFSQYFSFVLYGFSYAFSMIKDNITIMYHMGCFYEGEESVLVNLLDCFYLFHLVIFDFLWSLMILYFIWLLIFYLVFLGFWKEIPWQWNWFNIFLLVFIMVCMVVNFLVFVVGSFMCFYFLG